MPHTKTITCRVRPNASKSAITGQLSDGSYKIALKAPAEDGKANAELVRFLVETFQVPRNCIEILSGTTNRLKTVRITQPPQSAA